MGDKHVSKGSSKKTTIRIPSELLEQIVETANRRGRSVNTTILDLIEGGFDWLRSRFQTLK